MAEAGVTELVSAREVWGEVGVRSLEVWVKRGDEALVGLLEEGEGFCAVGICAVEFDRVVYDRIGLEMLCRIELALVEFQGEVSGN